MQTPATIELVRACQALDVDQARLALDDGADPNAGDAEGCPLPLSVLLVPDGPVDHLHRRSQLVSLLFKAGARKDPEWSFDSDLSPQQAIEFLVDRVMDRMEKPDWDEAGELSLLSTWLECGNSPCPEGIVINGKASDALGVLVYGLNEMESWKNEDDEDVRPIAWSFMRQMMGVLARAGYPLEMRRMERAGLDPDEAKRLLSESLSLVEEAALQQDTPLPASAHRPTPRL